MDQFHLSIRECVSAPVDQSFDGSKLIDVDHVVLPLEIDRVQVLLHHALFEERRVALVQLHLDNRAEDAEQVLRQVFALWHALLLHHHVLRGLPQELEERGIRGNQLKHLEDIDEVEVALEALQYALILLVQVPDGPSIALWEWLRRRGRCLLWERLGLPFDLRSEVLVSVLGASLDIHGL